MKTTLFLLAALACVAAVPDMIHPETTQPDSFTKLGSSGNSTLFRVNLPAAKGQFDYAQPPYVVELKGSHFQIGYDYAALLHNQTSFVFTTFLNSLGLTPETQPTFDKFIDWLWESFLMPHTPQQFLDELAGMEQWHAEHSDVGDLVPSHLVARRFYTMANLPADKDNIIAMLEQELEQGWPDWLKEIINWVIKQLIGLRMGCDAYGVWGSRTQDGLLYTSRNLDYNHNTGINNYKLVSYISLNDPKYYPNGGVNKGGKYAVLGFAFGIGALAGINVNGMTTSEMNLDNSVVTFSGVPFPLRLRYVLEQSTNLNDAMNVWNSTNNTNSFNFLIGSASDVNNSTLGGAYALETIMGYTGVFPANSPVEANSVYNCTPPIDCRKWTNQTGMVKIGKPIPEAVWRSNHGMNPTVMKTQEPLFWDTIKRYDLQHDLFMSMQKEGLKVNDTYALGVAATLGTKGKDSLSCDPSNFVDGSNIMSIVYAPGARDSQYSKGYFYIAWESGSGTAWRPAACSRYVKFALDQSFQ